MLATDRNGDARRAGIGSIRYLAVVMSIGMLLPGPHSSVCAQAGGAAKIAHYEPLNSLTLDVRTKPGTFQQLGASAVTTVSFETLGRIIVLDLVRNDRLVAKLRSRLPIGDNRLTIYKGSIRGVPGSWARLSIDKERISGIIWDGSEFLLIDPIGRLEGLPVAVGDRDRLAVVRLADIELPIDDGVRPAAAATTHSAEELLQDTAARARVFVASEGLTSRAISLGVVIDTALGNSISDEVQAAIEWTNVADGIFTEQLDIHLDLDYILNLKGMPDPFTSTDPGTLLTTLSNFKSSNADLSPLGLAHLLTRIDLDGTTRGIAFLASACGPSEGVSLTEARGSTIDALIMTHEIAHNLGAPHDNEPGSACASTPDGFIMSPTLNGSSTFSACSLSQMSAFLNTVSCLVPVAGSEIQLEAPVLPAQIYYKDQIKLDLNVHNIGLESVVDSQLQVTSNGAIDIIVSGASDRDCMNYSWNSQQTCDLDNLYAGETVTVATEISPQASGQQSLDIVASAANDTDPSNNAVSLVLDVLPATDAGVSGINLTDINTYQGGSVTYSLTANNFGDFDTMAVVSLQTEPNHMLSASANCVTPGAGQLDCDIGLLAAGASESFEFQVHADPNMGLGLAEKRIQYIDANLNMSLHNTARFPSGRFMFAVWGAFYDVEVGFATPPVSIDQGESSEFVAYVTNLGPDPVADLNFQADVAPGVTLGMPSADRGVCTTDGQLTNCELGQFDPGELVNVRIPYTGVTVGSYRMELFPDMNGGYEVSSAYPVGFAEFDVVSTAPPPPPPPPPPPVAPKPPAKSSGGTTSPLWLLVLIATLVRRIAVARQLFAYSRP